MITSRYSGLRSGARPVVARNHLLSVHLHHAERTFPVTCGVTCSFTSCWHPLKGISAGQDMLIRVRGAITPKSQCALTGEFTLGAGDDGPAWVDPVDDGMCGLLALIAATLSHLHMHLPGGVA
jgi:hypothetical protein